MNCSELTYKSSLPKVFFWMAIAIVSFTAMAIAIRETSNSLNTFEATAIRHFLGLIFLTSIMVFSKNYRPLFSNKSLPIQFIRNGIQFAGQSFWNLSMVLLPLATAFSLEFSTPLFTAILAVLFLKERVNKYMSFALGFGISGVGVILFPQIETLGPAILLPLSAALCFSISDIFTKKLTATQSAFSIMFFMCLLQLPMNLFFSEFGFWSRITTYDVLPLLILSFAGFAGHYALTKALCYGNASLVVPLDFLRLPLAIVIGFFFYSEKPEMIMIIGSSILLVGVFINLLGTKKE